jgi:hypothetical protein
MLTHPTLDKLQTLRLTGMYQALVEQLQMPDIATLTFASPGSSKNCPLRRAMDAMESC